LEPSAIQHRMNVYTDTDVSENHTSTIFSVQEVQIFLEQWRKACRITIFSNEADSC